MGNADKFELVTGHGPEPHVDADDHALLYASFIGPGVYRLTGVKTAEIEVTSENEVTISPGMFLIHGRFARVKDQISLTIETGSQGQNRNDLVVAEYSYSGNQTEIDDMELVVVTGTPANPGSETDPSIEDDLTLFDIEYGGSITSETIVQIPLWRVPKEGLTTQDPVALFKDYVDSDQARSSIVQKVVESGHTGGWFWFKYSNGICVLDGKVAVRATGGTAWGNVWHDSAIRGGEKLPITLKSIVVGTVHVIGGNGSFWATQATSGTTSTAPTWYAVRATKGTSTTNLQAAYHIVGTWR